MPIGKRKRNKAGRSREFQVARHPCGQVVRRAPEEREDEIVSIAVKARMQHHGVPADRARDPLMGAALGRHFRSGVITEEQHAAGIRFGIVADAYARAMQVKRVRSASDFNGPFGSSDDGIYGHDGTTTHESDEQRRRREEYEAWFQRATGDYRNARSALLAADPLALMVVEAVCMEDRDMPTSVGELRVGLNALARMWRIGRWQKFGG